MFKYVIVIFIFLAQCLHGQNLYFPPNTGTSWETLDPINLGWKTDALPELKNFLEETNTKAFIILKDGKIAVEYYLNGHDASSSWYWASAGKSLTSTLIGMAVSEGKIDLQKPSSEYLGKKWTSLSQSQEEKIKVIHHLNMTTGLDDSNFECTDPECLTFKAEPGSRWAYHNGPYTLCDGIIEGATSKNLNAYFKEKLGSKIGMNGIFVKSGYNNIFYSKARDMARFGLFILSKGNWKEEVIFSDKSYFEKMINTSQDINLSYGYLWWLNGKGSFQLPKSQLKFNMNLVPNAPLDMLCALGKNDQKIYVIPSENLVIIRMGEAGTADSNPVPIKYDFALWEKLNPVLNLTSSVKTTYFNKEKVSFVKNKSIFIDENIDAVDVKIYDLQGKLVHNFSHKNSSEIYHLPSGIYLVFLTDKNKKMYINKIWIR
jgi:CubicO group peptidase (beta-lactamase class C family)